MLHHENIVIVLVGTSHPGNIGAAARVMKNMRLTHLRLVNPHEFPSHQATSMASGADDILAQAQVYPSLEAALADCQLVFATSARNRHLAWPSCSPRDAVTLMQQKGLVTTHSVAGNGHIWAKNGENLLSKCSFITHKLRFLKNIFAVFTTKSERSAKYKAKGGEQIQGFQNKIAVVFGREKSGLSNAELAMSHYHININTNPQFASLNLATAVAIMAYEINNAHLDSVPEAVTTELATQQDVQRFFEHLQQVLINKQFLDPNNPKHLMLRLQRLFNRAQLEKVEVNILRGMLTAMQNNMRSE